MPTHTHTQEKRYKKRKKKNRHKTAASKNDFEEMKSKICLYSASCLIILDDSRIIPKQCINQYARLN